MIAPTGNIRPSASASDGAWRRPPCGSMPSPWGSRGRGGIGACAACSASGYSLRAHHLDPTGRARARALFGDAVDIRFLPYDTPGSVGRFLDRSGLSWRSSWKRSFGRTWCGPAPGAMIPVVFASARLTAKSVSRYRRFGSLFRDTVAASALIAAQSSEDAERFIAVGADPRGRAWWAMRNSTCARRLGAGGGPGAAPDVPWAETGVDRRQHPRRRGRTGARRPR